MGEAYQEMKDRAAACGVEARTILMASNKAEMQAAIDALSSDALAAAARARGIAPAKINMAFDKADIIKLIEATLNDDPRLGKDIDRVRSTDGVSVQASGV